MIRFIINSIGLAKFLHNAKDDKRFETAFAADNKVTFTTGGVEYILNVNDLQTTNATIDVSGRRFDFLYDTVRNMPECPIVIIITKETITMRTDY